MDLQAARKHLRCAVPELGSFGSGRLRGAKVGVLGPSDEGFLAGGVPLMVDSLLDHVLLILFR